MSERKPAEWAAPKPCACFRPHLGAEKKFERLCASCGHWQDAHPRPVVIYTLESHGRYYGKKGRELWRERKVIGETRVSWILEPAYDSRKIPKNGRHNRQCVAFSWEEVDAVTWAGDNRYRVARAVEKVDDATLRKVAELIGYQEETRS